jgi:hypothetical protein
MRQIPLAFAAAALLAAGCASKDSIHSQGFTTAAADEACQPSDNAANCYILVDAWYDKGEKKCTVEVVGSQRDVGFERGANGQDKTIRWKLTDSAEKAGFLFVAVQPKYTSPGSPENAARWGTNFSNGGTEQSGKRYRWKNANKDAQAGTDYYYLVTVQLPQPAPAIDVACTYDPVIRNQR